MGKKLFVGGLPYETNDAQLKEMFGACGQVVSAKVIIDKATGRSKGFGFVEMSTDEQAQAATAKLNNSTLGTRKIFVNEARPMEPRPAGGYPPRPTGGFSDKPSFGGGGFPEKKSSNRNFGPDKKSGGRNNDYDKKRKRGGGDYDKKGFGGKKGKDRDNGYDGW
jgi:RNA recognition motif-containing protein